MVPISKQTTRTDSPGRYGSISRIFHWGMAFLIGWQALKIFDRIDDGEHWVGETLVPAHVTVGTLLLVLVVFRIAWALNQKDNRPSLGPAIRMPARAGHILLYALMALMPVTGALAVIGGGHGWNAFGIQLVAKGPEIPWMSTIGGLHSPLGLMLLAMIAGHIGMALYHQLVRKDGLLRRMV